MPNETTNHQYPLNREDQYHALKELGGNALSEGNFQEATEWFRMAEGLARKIEKKQLIKQSEINFAAAYFLKSGTEPARRQLQ